MKLLIIGQGRHGKDTVAEILRDYWGWSFRSSSHWAAEHVILPKAQQVHPSVDWDWKWLYDNRHDASQFFCGRQYWYDQILAYNKEHGGDAVCKGVLKEADIYVGMRSLYEFNASTDHFDHIIWVEATERLGKTEDESTMELYPTDADIIIDNNGSMVDLWYEIEDVNKLLKAGAY